jgi:hypothetical protein
MNEDGSDDGAKVLYPLKWNDAKTAVVGILSYFDTSWTGLAQWIYISGGKLVPGDDTSWNDFGIRQAVSTSESNKKIYCSQSGTTNPCESDGSFSWNQSGLISVFNYMEIGNYFSDFGVNITAYGFSNFENSAVNPYKSQ